MKLHRYATLSLLLMLISLELTGCSKTPEDRFNRGKILLAKGDTRGAILEIKNTLQAQPNNGEARLLLGKTYLAIEAYADAEKELNRARDSGIATDKVLPLLAWAYLRMGEAQKALDLGIPPGSLNRQDMAAMQAIRAEALIQLGKRAEAEIPLAAAEQADSGHPHLLVLKARLAVDNKAPDEAKKYIDAALKRDPTYTYAYYLKAALLEAEGKHDEALQTYQQALKHDPKAFRAYLAISNVEFRRGQPEASEKALQAAEKAAPNHPLVRYTRGMFELRRNDLKAANDALLQVLRVAPNYMPAQLATAMVNLGLGNYEQAIKNAERVLAEQPNNELAKRVLAATQLKLGDPKDALATLIPLLEQRPDDVKLLALASKAYQQSENYPQALKLLNQAEALDPNDPSLKQQKAVSLLAMGQTDQAMAELERASSLSDKDVRADISIITLDLQRNEFDKALKAIDALEKKLPNKAFTHNLRAMAFLGKNDKTSARKSLERALALDPKHVPAAISMAYLELSENHVDAARKRFEGILAQTSNNLQAMLGLANIALLNKQEKDHAAWLEKAAKTHPEAIQPRVLLSRYYLNKNDPAKALALAKEAVSNNPNDPNAIDFLAAMQLAGNNPIGAVDTYKKLIAKSPDSGEAHYRLALAQITAKNPAEGRASLNRALTLKPDLIPAMDTLIRLDLEEKQAGAALQWAKKIQALQPNASLGYEREGDILMVQNQAVMAAKAYQRAQDKRATSLGMIKLHTALARAGETKSAQAKLEQWLKTNPTDTRARYHLASQAMLQGQDKLAIAQFEEVLRRRPDNAETLNNLANLYQRTNDPRAFEFAERAYKIKPQDLAIQDTLGWLWVEKGSPEKGLDLLAKAAGQAPKIPTIQYHYAVALARTGDKTKASTLLQRTLGSGVDFPEAKAAQELLAKLK